MPCRAQWMFLSHPVLSREDLDWSDSFHFHGCFLTSRLRINVRFYLHVLFLRSCFPYNELSPLNTHPTGYLKITSFGLDSHHYILSNHVQSITNIITVTMQYSIITLALFGSSMAVTNGVVERQATSTMSGMTMMTMSVMPVSLTTMTETMNGKTTTMTMTAGSTMSTGMSGMNMNGGSSLNAGGMGVGVAGLALGMAYGLL
ncbi:hypothetical protein EJ08DRAFT_482751 [Tothia fuscella]|uniref:Uncharacterized protein n=1 Tax=Tothia fuscella TaxID=1048955 RepID=A0A9P4TTC1_9PEZI|nr:hypothetical protein EJ08DRAFT_482751 [Tothia fuscella]